MSLVPGDTLGPRTIRAELGLGGMGVVYTAQDPRLKRQVAIKLLPPDLTRDETAKQRFLQEAQAASALDHTNICTIYEINETDDGQLYRVMAYYEGETLKELIERGPLALNPESSSAHYAQGWVHAQRGAPRQAVRHWREAVRLETNHGQAHAVLSYWLAASGHFSSARRYAERYRAPRSVAPALREQPRLRTTI
ncbi:MAG: hypothetical protein CL477_18925 [Acidobacteria bacterium]|jgi:Flp pilus assembly protein TadD|nr:hypothetical protein [Acidobacteriota bacterium]HJN46735.1 protein kinase [Vicinamibacterales bacterium]